MKLPSHAESLELLCLLAADEGRGLALFGSSLDRVRTVLPPFMIGKPFPLVYLEFPLAGEPYLDVNVAYADLGANDCVDSTYAPDAKRLLEWYISAKRDYPDISFGYVLDTNMLNLAAAGFYLQPRRHSELVAPFCQIAGEPERAASYLNLEGRMPRTWPLAYLGMFKGRPDSPLRVGGYLEKDAACAELDCSEHFAKVFDQIGFTAYDDHMLAQISELMQAAPSTVDFQFDVYPGGALGDMFSLEVKFGVARTELVHESFANGPGARIMHLLESWGIADERWKLGVEATLARTVPVELPNGTEERFAFIIMPQWVKVRWRGARLQPAKLYHVADAGPVPHSAHHANSS